MPRRSESGRPQLESVAGEPDRGASEVERETQAKPATPGPEDHPGHSEPAVAIADVAV